MRWWRRLSLRARLIIIGVAGLAAGFALGGLALIAALDLALQHSADQQARQTTDDVVALVNAGALPAPLPVAGAEVVQVVDGQGRVRSASIGADRLVPLLNPAERAWARSDGPLEVAGARAGVRGPLRVYAAPAGPAGDPQTVLVALPVGEARQTVQVLRTTLLVAYPLLIVGLAGLAWRVVGAALRPVEQLRAGAERITTVGSPNRPVPAARAGGEPGRAGLHPARRLPVPQGHDEIHRLAVTLNGMLARLETARAQQRAFVADAAHELRSPLANMLTQLEVARRVGATTDWPSIVDDLLFDAHRLARLADDLLLLARADDAGPANHDRRPVEVAALLQALARDYQAARVPVRVAASEAQWTVGDPQSLRRIVANLIDNAVRHARTGVTVAVTAGDEGPVVSVVDDGDGIPEADRERVFDRFTRLDEARDRDAGGAGLGLAIVRELAGQLGGSVRLTDAGPGVRAEVSLPGGARAAYDGDSTDAASCPPLES